MVPQPIEQKRLIIDPAVIDSNHLTVGEFLFTLAYMLGYNLNQVADHMVEMGLAHYELDEAQPSMLAMERVRKCLGPSANVTMKEDELLELAKKMKDLYPKGNQQVGIPWAEGPKLIAQRLENFFRKFGNYSSEDVLKATELYVTFMQPTGRMRVLKNFIYRDTQTESGLIETTSDLYTILENPNAQADNSEDWNIELN